ncbi:MAG: protoporphyrinogen oxidase [Candidatus Firestonebacteria bacterium]|nr:protoporphyrinogen oxidase [Candidatus Firestonebacteria bacterium]
MKKIVIIGGGISGLSIAYFIIKQFKQKNKKAEIVLIERNSQLGGNITTYSKDGFVIEGGPDCFISEKPWAIRLCEEIGLSDEFVVTKEENKCTYVLNKGKLVELPDGLMLMIPTKITPFLMTSLISFPGKIRMGMDLFIPKKKNDFDESLGSFVRRRLGQEALDKIAEPLIAGIHAGDPESMSLRNTFPRFLDMEKKYGSLIKGMLAGMKQKAERTKEEKSEINKRTMFMSLRGGLIVLINKIQEKILPDTRILLNKSVNSINKIDSEQGTQYEIKLSDKSIETADIVIITTPAYEAGKAVSVFDNELSYTLNNFPYVSTATVSVGFKRSDIKHDLHGFGFVIPRKEKRKIMATTWTSQKFPNRANEDYVLLRAFLGGVYNQDVLIETDAKVLEIVLNEWRSIMNIEAEPVLHKIFRWNRAMPQYVLGHENTVKKIEGLASQHKGLIIAGNFLKGVGISDCILNAENTANNIVDTLI